MPVKNSNFRTRHDFLNKVVEPMIKERNKLGMTQEELDFKLGVADRLVSHWECGRRTPTAFNLFCWAEALYGEIIFRSSRNLETPKDIIAISCNDNCIEADGKRKKTK